MRRTAPHLCVSACIGGLSITAKERIEHNKRLVHFPRFFACFVGRQKIQSTQIVVCNQHFLSNELRRGKLG